MVTVISLLVAGIILGYLLRNRRKFLVVSARLTDGAIFLLLFFLGVSVGMNEEVISNFQNIGLQAFLLTVLATLGSVLVTWLFYLLFFRKR
jgi:uncharacterized membrane protein YbjE (DUF340 family)